MTNFTPAPTHFDSGHIPMISGIYTFLNTLVQSDEVCGKS